MAACFLEAIAPAHLDVALSALAHLEARAKQIDQQARRQIEHAQYEADLAGRRYRAVDPDNRLVARSLEREWNEKTARGGSDGTGIPGLAQTGRADVVGCTIFLLGSPPGEPDIHLVRLTLQFLHRRVRHGEAIEGTIAQIERSNRQDRLLRGTSHHDDASPLSHHIKRPGCIEMRRCVPIDMHALRRDILDGPGYILSLIVNDEVGSQCSTPLCLFLISCSDQDPPAAGSGQL